MEDISCSSGDQLSWKTELDPNKSTDSEMLKTYATGLLAMSLIKYVNLAHSLRSSMNYFMRNFVSLETHQMPLLSFSFALEAGCMNCPF